MQDEVPDDEYVVYLHEIRQLQAALAAAREEVERYHEAVEYAKEHLDTTLKNFVDSLVDGRTERCPACGCPTLKKSFVACCEYHGHVCEDCWGDCL